jgi:hypothetical protein
MAIGDVGEDPSLGGLVDEVPVLDIQDRDDRAGCLMNDSVDHL